MATILELKRDIYSRFKKEKGIKIKKCKKTN